MSALRSLRTALLASIALSLLLVSSSMPVFAQSGPEQAVHDLVDAVVAKDPDAVSRLVCDAELDRLLSQFDLPSDVEDLPLGLDGQLLLDAFTIELRDKTVTLIEETEQSALVALSASFEMGLDEAALRELMGMLLETFGEGIDVDTIEPMLPMLVSQYSTMLDIDDDVRLIFENGAWTVCDDLSGVDPVELSEGTLAGTDGASLCDLISLDELNGLSVLQYASTFGAGDVACTFASGIDGGFHTLSFSVLPGQLAPIKSIFAGGIESTVAGLPAYGQATTLWVELGEGLLSITPNFADTAGSEDMDHVAYAAQAADIIIPRWLER